MNKNNLLLSFIAIISIVTGLLSQQYLSTNKAVPINSVVKPNSTEHESESSGSQLTEFTLPDLEGMPHSISEWNEKIRIINFWATWCPPCLKEIPEFIKIQHEYSHKNLQFIGIAIDDKESAADYLAANPVNYPILIAGDGGISLSQQLGNVFKAVPFTVIINQAGQIIHRQTGEISTEKIQQLIKPLLHNNQ
jgi:thiol-disulfide isomerase/thioredoxin